MKRCFKGAQFSLNYPPQAPRSGSGLSRSLPRAALVHWKRHRQDLGGAAWPRCGQEAMLTFVRMADEGNANDGYSWAFNFSAQHLPQPCARVLCIPKTCGAERAIGSPLCSSPGTGQALVGDAPDLTLLSQLSGDPQKKQKSSRFSIPENRS